MTNLTKVKLAFALMGVILFGGGVRYESAELRWGGIGMVAVAWALRFVKRGEKEG